MRIITQFTVAVAAVVMLGCLAGSNMAQAQSSAPSAGTTTDASAQSRSGRPRVRVYRDDNPQDVYPRYNPGPNAVRDCTANLVQEYRPSGSVIVPRMNCYWRRG